MRILCEIDFLVTCFMSTFGCFATVALRHLNVHTSSQNSYTVKPFQVHWSRDRNF